MQEHLFSEFALTPLTFGLCTSPTDTFPFTYHFPSVPIPIRQPLNYSPICTVENFQCFQRQIDILDNPLRRRCSHLSIYRDNFLSFIIEHRKTLPCYFHIFFNLYLIHSKTEQSLLLVLKGSFLRLIVSFINTSFHIHFTFLIYWKQNIIIIHSTCCR